MSAVPTTPLFSAEKIIESVLDKMLEGLQVIDSDWRYVYVNQTVADQGKKKKEDLIGKTMMEAYPGIDLSPLFAQMKKAMNEKVSITLENKFDFPDGSIGWFQLYIHPWENGIVILSIDITHKKRLEQELQEKVYELDRLSLGISGRENKMTELKGELNKLKLDIMDLDVDVV